MKTSTIITITAGVLVLSACSGFLDVKPTNSDDAKTAVRTAGDAQVVINGLMRSMTSVNYYGRNFILYGDARGGDLTIASQGRGQDALYTFNHTASSNSYSGFWSHLYDGILQINNLLENSASVESEDSNEDFGAIKGQALTARALIYFDLVRLYGKAYTDDPSAYGVPNITTTLPYNAQPLRASGAENYEQIVHDLEAAALLLPTTHTNGYLNYYANKALQARVFLHMGDYPGAL